MLRKELACRNDGSFVTPFNTAAFRSTMSFPGTISARDRTEMDHFRPVPGGNGTRPKHNTNLPRTPRLDRVAEHDMHDLPSLPSS